MIIPKDIKTMHKIRDAYICNLYLQEDMSAKEIADKVNLSERQVSRILYANRAVLKIDEGWERIRRIHWLKRQLKKRQESRKDPADLLQQLKEEIEEKQSWEGKPETKVIVQVVNQLDNAKEISSSSQRSGSEGNRIEREANTLLRE